MRNMLLLSLSLLLLHSCSWEKPMLPPEYPEYFDGFVGSYSGPARWHGWQQYPREPVAPFDETFTVTVAVDYYSETQLLVSAISHPITVDATGFYGDSTLPGALSRHIRFRNDSLFYLLTESDPNHYYNYSFALAKQ